MSFAEDVCKAVNAVIFSGDIAQGSKVAEFEERMAEYVGTKYAVAVSNGTDGLYLCLLACGIGKGDKVITTPYTFIATVNSILWTKARPVFADIDRETYNMDWKNVIDEYGITWAHNKTRKAIMPVDVFGNPVHTGKMQGMYNNSCNEHAIDLEAVKIILDSCESLGSKIDRPFDAQVFAFYPNKQLTTGEGGMICTNNADIADYCRAARNHGRLPGDTALNSSIMGYNFRTTDMQAAMGIEQLKRIDEIMEKRLCVYECYLKKLPEKLVQYPRWDKAPMKMFSPFVFTVEVDNRDKVMQYLQEHGIETRAYFPCVTDMPHIKKLGYNTDDYPVAKEVASRTLALPFYADMTEAEVDEVCDMLKQALT